MDGAGTRPLATPLIRVGVCLIVFLQFNDTLLEFFKPLPLFNLISASTALLIFFSISRPDPKQRFMEAWFVFVPIAALITLSAFSRFYAVDTEKVMEDTIRMVKICLMVLILAYGIRSTKDLMAVIHAFIFSSTVLGGFVILEAIHGQPLLQVERHEETLDLFDGFFRSSGLSMESPPMAATLTLCGAAMSAVMFVRRKKARLFYALGFIVSAAALIVSLTRSATITLAIIVLILVWRLRHRRGFPWIVLGTASVVLVSVTFLPPEVWEKLQVVFDPGQDHTILRRLSYQIIGWDLFVQHPVFGVGSGNFNEHYASPEYRFVPGRGDEPRPLHNLYLQYLSELGILGFALFVGLIGSVSRSLGRVASSSRSSDLRLLADALLIGFLSSLFQLFFISSNFLFSFWAIVGLTVAVVHLDRTRANAPQQAPKRQWAGGKDGLIASE